MSDTPKTDKLRDRWVSDPYQRGDYILDLNPEDTERFFAEVEKLERELAALKAELESVRKGSAKACQELRNEIARLNGQTRWQCTCGGTDCEGRRENAELLTDKERLEKLLDIDVRVPTRDGWWHFNCRSDVDAYRRAGR